MECDVRVGKEGSSQVSSFQEVEVKEHVTLLPSYLGKIPKGVIELLSSRVLLYHTTYNGVLLSFSQVRIINSVGHILDELPHIHIDVVYTATVFRPQVGEVMCGSVNRVGVDHIGCLLFNCFNVSVVCTATDPLRIQDSLTSKPDEGVRPGRLTKLQRKTLKSWCNRRFTEGEAVWFSVSKVEITGSILSLRGEYVAVDVMMGKGEGREEGGEEGEEVPVNGLDGSITSDDTGAVEIRKKVKKVKKKCSKFDSTTGLEQGKRSKDRSRKRKKSTSDTTSESEGGAKRTKAVEEKAGVLLEDTACSQSGCSVETRDSVGKERSDNIHLKTRRKHKH